MPINICEQTISFLACFSIGLIMGLVYDICSGIRLAFKPNKIWIFFMDSLFWLILTIVYFATVYITCGGEMRWYVLVGMMFGLLLYIIGISCHVRPVFKQFFKFFYKMILKISNIIIYPILKIFVLFKFVCQPLIWFVQYILKFVINFSKNAVEKVRHFIIKLNRYCISYKKTN